MCALSAKFAVVVAVCWPAVALHTNRLGSVPPLQAWQPSTLHVSAGSGRHSWRDTQFGTDNPARRYLTTDSDMHAMPLPFLLVTTKLVNQLVQRRSALLRPLRWPGRNLRHQAESIVTGTGA